MVTWEDVAVAVLVSVDGQFGSGGGIETVRFHLLQDTG